MDNLFYFCLVLLCFHARLFVDALRPPAVKGPTSWLSFVMSDFDVDLCPFSYLKAGFKRTPLGSITLL